MVPEHLSGRSPVDWLFTDRHGGVSGEPFDSLNLAEHVGDNPPDVHSNRDKAAAALGLRWDRLAFISAAHGNDVAVVQEPGTYADVDALVTTQRQVGLVALAADCVTIALADTEAGVAGAVHSGWRGVAADVAAAAVEQMSALGARPDQIQAKLGPAACPDCYEVSAGVRDQVAAAAPAAASTTRVGTPAVALHAGVRQQLAAVGVTQVEADDRCTMECVDLYSYRREGRTGRHGVLVALR